MPAPRRSLASNIGGTPAETELLHRWFKGEVEMRDLGLVVRFQNDHWGYLTLPLLEHRNNKDAAVVGSKDVGGVFRAGINHRVSDSLITIKELVLMFVVVILDDN